MTAALIATFSHCLLAYATTRHQLTRYVLRWLCDSCTVD